MKDLAFGHRLHQIRCMQRQYISQGQYWLAREAKVHEATLLASGPTRSLTIPMFVPSEHLMWPTKKIHKQMTPATLEPGRISPGDRIRSRICESTSARAGSGWR